MLENIVSEGYWAQCQMLNATGLFVVNGLKHMSIVEGSMGNAK